MTLDLNIYSLCYSVLLRKTNFMHNLFLIYFVEQPVHVSGVFIAHHQEVFNVYVQQLVSVIRFGDWQPPVTKTYNTYQLLYIYIEYFLMMGNKYARNMYRLFY
jgi:hypothetical protein